MRSYLFLILLIGCASSRNHLEDVKKSTAYEEFVKKSTESANNCRVQETTVEHLTSSLINKRESYTIEYANSIRAFNSRKSHFVSRKQLDDYFFERFSIDLQPKVDAITKWINKTPYDIETMLWKHSAGTDDEIRAFILDSASLHNKACNDAMVSEIESYEQKKVEELKNEPSTGMKILRGVGLVLSAFGGASTQSSGDANGINSNNTCYSDSNCTYGLRCFKSNNQLQGTCGQPVDSFGNPDYTNSYKNYGGGLEGKSCGFDTDCPIGFSCKKSLGQLNGLCAK